MIKTIFKAIYIQQMLEMLEKARRIFIFWLFHMLISTYSFSCNFKNKKFFNDKK